MAEGRQMAKAAGFIMITMAISRLLGYLRDLVIYANFGQNWLTDAYNAAFSIPDFLYMLLVGGALSSAFIPVFSSYLTEQREEEAWEAASIVFNWVLLLMLVGVGAGCLYTPQLIILLVPGLPPESQGLTIQMTRIMFIQVILMACSGISMGILNSYKRFNAPAIGSILYNLGIILIGYFLSIPYGIVGFSLGVVAGALLHFVVQLPTLWKIGLRYRFSFNLLHPGVLQLIRLMVPVLIGLSVMQINLFINQHLASNLNSGMITALRTGQRLMQLPIGIFAMAISIAFFPALNEYAAKKDHQEFSRIAFLGLRAIIFLALPATVGLIVLRVPLVRFLLQTGKFTGENTGATAHALLFYSLGICAYAAIQLLSRTFYALQDTLTPVLAGVLTIALNLALNFAFLKPLGHGGLALAYSLAGLFNMLVLLWALRRKLGDIRGKQLFSFFNKSLAASLLMGLVLYWVVAAGEAWFGIDSKSGQFLQVALAVVVGGMLYGSLSLILQVEEAKLAWDLLSSRVRKGRLAPL